MTRIIFEIDGKEASSLTLQPAGMLTAQPELASAAARNDTDAGRAPTGITASSSEIPAALPAISAAVDAGSSREQRAAPRGPAKKNPKRK